MAAFFCAQKKAKLRFMQSFALYDYPSANKLEHIFVAFAWLFSWCLTIHFVVVDLVTQS